MRREVAPAARHRLDASLQIGIALLLLALTGLFMAGDLVVRLTVAHATHLRHELGSPDCRIAIDLLETTLHPRTEETP